MWPLIDLVIVAIFVAIGRTVHDHANRLTGFVSTAWPFVAGLVLAWLVLTWRRRSGRSTSDGAFVTLITVTVAMVLRVLAGQGTAFAFIIVALVFLGVPMIGWRLAGRVASRRRRHGAHS